MIYISILLVALIACMPLLFMGFRRRNHPAQVVSMKKYSRRRASRLASSRGSRNDLHMAGASSGAGSGSTGRGHIQKCSYCREEHKRLTFYAGEQGSVAGVCKNCKVIAERQGMLPL
ncbi:hypothetical protein Q5741_10995 [Paenibacillus sp. JX-17]|uniref:Uncharacterized protein n=1 Tax=Paenibacillus lacisoli TaxID=3064525 RepID=A0ABT9CGZ9_9BACL|nr:hypothetical protein [Paenibacillus sp. JX-17]MDO7906941.1 hypothetical protein [Paenibacillus sp. JX-17]